MYKRSYLFSPHIKDKISLRTALLGIAGVSWLAILWTVWVGTVEYTGMLLHITTHTLDAGLLSFDEQLHLIKLISLPVALYQLIQICNSR